MKALCLPRLVSCLLFFRLHQNEYENIVTHLKFTNKTKQYYLFDVFAELRVTPLCLCVCFSADQAYAGGENGSGGGGAGSRRGQHHRGGGKHSDRQPV